MSITKFEQKNNVKLIAKKDSWLMKALGFFLEKTHITPGFMSSFWTTYRLPFCEPVISYPSSVEDPTEVKHSPVLEHEMVHVEDMRSAWGLFKMFWLVWLLPLPVLFSGRWFIERHAYLHNLINHRGYTVEWSIDTLWKNYLWAWPKPLMKKWFEKKLAEHKAKEDK